MRYTSRMRAVVSWVKGLLAACGLEIRRFRPGDDGPRRSNFGEQDIIFRLVDGIPGLRRFCVDIGAGDGVLHSNSLALFEKGWQGAALELDGDRFGRMAWRHRGRPGVRMARARVAPPIVASLLRGLEVPRDFGFLSLDIDGYDYFVLEAILAEFSPAVLCVEINEKIPPPVRFTVLWREDYVWNRDHFFGQSLSQAHSLASPKGYALAAVEYNNAFFVRREFHSGPDLSPEQAYRQGYLERPDRLRRLPWNRDVEEWQGIEPEAAAGKIRARFAKYEGLYLLEWD